METKSVSKPRIDYQRMDGVKGMMALEQQVRHSNLDPALRELIKLRASQINGCAYCIDMHTKDARAAGETEQRLYALSAWHEAPFFSERERAALRWTEALTLISENDVPDSLYDAVRQQFSEEEIVNLSLAIIAINGWNRLAISLRSVAGSYKPELTK